MSKREIPEDEDDEEDEEDVQVEDDEPVVDDGEDDDDELEGDALYEEDPVLPDNVDDEDEIPVVVPKPDIKKKKKKTKWSNEFDSAAAFQEYLARLAPVIVTESVEAKYARELEVAFPVVMDMIRRRGFTPCDTVTTCPTTLVVSVDGVELSPVPAEVTKNEDFFGASSTRKNSVCIRAGKNQDNEICLVVYCGIKMCVQAARDLGNLQMVNPRVQTLVILTGAGATPIASKCLQAASTAFYQIFKTRELLLPFVDHAMNSTHKVLSPIEKKAFLKQRMVPDETKMPLVAEDDAYAKFYGMRPGDLVHFVTKYGGVLGHCSSYKLVGTAN